MNVPAGLPDGVSRQTAEIVDRLARYPRKRSGELAKEMGVKPNAVYFTKWQYKDAIAAHREELLKRKREQEKAKVQAPSGAAGADNTTMSLAMQKAISAWSKDDNDETVFGPDIERPVDTKPADDTAALLARRGSVYGDFKDNAALAQALKMHVYAAVQRSGKALPAEQAEAMDFVLSKIARISNGTPNQRDSWDDIAGYAKLAAASIKE
jgi:uncharacterized protein